MFFTARQLEDLHKSNGSNGHVVLPYRARLSPLAQDWVRSKKVSLGYSDGDAKEPKPSAASQLKPNSASAAAKPQKAGGAVLWWCDGPCGPAKAAIAAQARESDLRAIELPAETRELVPVIRLLAREIATASVSAGVLLVRSAAVATVLANRCPGLRAVVGTCLEAVDQGVSQAAANVLIIEHPFKTLPQVKSMLAKFVRGSRQSSDELSRQLKELASCG